MQVPHTYHKSNAQSLAPPNTNASEKKADSKWKKYVSRPVCERLAALHLQKCPEKSVGTPRTSEHLAKVFSISWRYLKTF